MKRNHFRIISKFGVTLLCLVVFLINGFSSAHLNLLLEGNCDITRLLVYLVNPF
uniref:Uncharacterized protein n=1 Tax=Anguilla anguilla TaxID=7936 RepID=A0A0E9WNB0_ANGAN